MCKLIQSRRISYGLIIKKLNIFNQVDHNIFTRQSFQQIQFDYIWKYHHKMFQMIWCMHDQMIIVRILEQRNFEYETVLINYILDEIVGFHLYKIVLQQPQTQLLNWKTIFWIQDWWKKIIIQFIIFRKHWQVIDTQSTSLHTIDDEPHNIFHQSNYILWKYRIDQISHMNLFLVIVKVTMWFDCLKLKIKYFIQINDLEHSQKVEISIKKKSTEWTVFFLKYNDSLFYCRIQGLLRLFLFYLQEQFLIGIILLNYLLILMN